MTSPSVVVSRSGHVVTAELNRPPANYFDEVMLAELADLLEELSQDPQCRAVVLCAAGKHFCAGANFAGRTPPPESSLESSSDAGSDSPMDASVESSVESSLDAGSDSPAAGIYRQAVRLFDAQVPIVAAVQGSAVGGGLGLACVADFRVASPQTRFLANFSRLGFHQGFGLTVTLPEIVGRQPALEMLYTSARIDGARALAIGLADRLVPAEDLRAAAHHFAEEIAASAPLAVAAIRQTMRQGLADRVRAAIAHELAEQTRLTQTADWAEGIRASLDRRTPIFEGR